MYPLRDGLLFARNQWYIAAWSSEVTHEPLARTILGARLVMFRTASGSVAALADSCIHRRFPLSLGTVDGNEIVCGYHGFQFDQTGKCTKIATQERVPSGFAVRSYPLVEKWQWIWVWMGDPDKVDTSLIPDHHDIRIERDGWYAVKGNYHHLNARYLLLTENLLDLSHLSFIHVGSIGSPEIAKTPVDVGTGDSDLRVARNVRNAEIPKAFQAMLNCPPRADRLNTTDYFPPTLFSAGSAIYESETENLYGAWRVIHFATPETAHSTHYFWAFTRNFAHGDEGVTKIFLDVNKQVFAEDIRALEALEASLSPNASTRDDRSAAADAGALRGRRMLEEMIEQELAVGAGVLSFEQH